jgi:hypothetical protein
VALIDCRWACMKCQQMGTVRPWGHSEETPMETAQRHARATRNSCVGGCGYAAIPIPLESPPADDAVDPSATDTGKLSTRA